MKKLTKRRIKRIEEVVAKRQPDLLVALNAIKNPHNASAIARTADAVGIYQLYTDNAMLFKASTSKGAHRWLIINYVQDMPSFLKQKRREGFQVVVTYVHGGVPYTEIDYTKPTVLVMGNEAEGVEEEVLEVADKRIWIPMYGMVESLNVSVATAVILYEALKQRQTAGFYNKIRLEDSERRRLIEYYTGK